MPCLQKIRVLQKRAVRIIAHINYYTHAFPITNELGILLLDDFIIYSRCMFMFKIFNSAFPHFFNVNFCKLSNMSMHSTIGNWNLIFMLDLLN